MSEALFEVPLFPLNVVLFPGMALPLHIFELRYRQMVADCLADRAPFGIALALPESVHEPETPAPVGTLARIADYEELPDGRYNLLALGTRRFAIVEKRHERRYLTGLVRPLRDDGSEPETECVQSARTALYTYLRLVLKLVGSEHRQIEVPTEPEELSYLIGICLTCEDGEKQRLLEVTSVGERLRQGVALLHKETEALQQQSPGDHVTANPVDRLWLN
ncbi:MAG TPA: LON peptidase substrate-binding domain-containing protein [Ktedonobacterales bacterium]